MKQDDLTIDELCQFMNQFAPVRLAEDWDNVGLLAGDRNGPANRVMTCLTITPESAQEAIDEKVDLIIAHHPLPFQPVKRLTTDQIPSRMLWNLARAGVAIYSPHTGFDSAKNGINFSLADKLGLESIRPLVISIDDPESLGAGRIGELPGNQDLGSFVQSVKSAFQLQNLKCVGELSKSISRVAVACGSGGSFLDHAIQAECDVFVTGEASFHACLEAKARGVALILLGHHTSERFAVEELAVQLASRFASLSVWASKKESDPIAFV